MGSGGNTKVFFSFWCSYPSNQVRAKASKRDEIPGTERNRRKGTKHLGSKRFWLKHRLTLALLFVSIMVGAGGFFQLSHDGSRISIETIGGFPETMTLTLSLHFRCCELFQRRLSKLLEPRRLDNSTREFFPASFETNLKNKFPSS